MPETLAEPGAVGANCKVNSQLPPEGIFAPQVGAVGAKGPSGIEKEIPARSDLLTLVTVILPAALFDPTLTRPNFIELKDTAN
jgi:hypothetical protein